MMIFGPTSREVTKELLKAVLSKSTNFTWRVFHSNAFLAGSTKVLFQSEITLGNDFQLIETEIKIDQTYQ